MRHAFYRQIIENTWTAGRLIVTTEANHLLPALLATDTKLHHFKHTITDPEAAESPLTRFSPHKALSPRHLL